MNGWAGKAAFNHALVAIHISQQFVLHWEFSENERLGR